MRTLLFLTTAATVMGLAFWAYRENYRTHSELAEVRDLRQQIGLLSESLGVLRAEWAYLNRPDRLRELADINFARLELLPIDPAQFGEASEVVYPTPAALPLSEPVDTAALTAADTGTGTHTGPQTGATP